MTGGATMRKNTDRPSFRTMKQTVVTILVGKTEKAYIIHLDLLIHYSEYFRAAFTGSFKEAEDKKISLSDVKKSTFDRFVDWLYYREISPTEEDKDPETGRLQYRGIIELYILGDKYQIPKLRKYVIDHIFQSLTTSLELLPSPGAIARAYEFLPETSPMRKFMLDIFARRFTPYYITRAKKMNKNPSCLQNEFLIEALIKIADNTKAINQNQRSTLKLKLCDYHEHADDKERKQCEQSHGVADIDR
ncbi:hypothetical protein BU16DRAFT_621758 [Lophium mytilinum]|uniref:BTB domain-containing protein n=1 Tax=Lophium mytilinum TaxID=390894 RepID=A0A6A6QHI6_9PEZI|nr:hypothetical protein BU16DRAFT_621758 [Lophium mytilinum]